MVSFWKQIPRTGPGRETDGGWSAGGPSAGGLEGAMMNRTTLALAALLVALAARPAHAQVLGSYAPFTNPYARPPLSPYLNLNRGGIPAVNYYGLVRPQLQTERFIQQQEILAGQAAPVGQ